MLRCLELCCNASRRVVDKFSGISSIPSTGMLKYVVQVDKLDQPHSLADNLYTRELDKVKLNHPNSK